MATDEDNYHVKKGQCHNQSESGYDGTDKPTKYCYNIRYPIGGREKRYDKQFKFISVYFLICANY